jgi:hypothetical protein
MMSDIKNNLSFVLNTAKKKKKDNTLHQNCVNEKQKMGQLAHA